ALPMPRAAPVMATTLPEFFMGVSPDQTVHGAIAHCAAAGNAADSPQAASGFDARENPVGLGAPIGTAGKFRRSLA
ncbi:hypothetical protein, partial [Escherichia coli]|uniref:hypothetical protein n=1 Tax=Escherichia coli TaxID=562 RepID=UPI0013CFD3A2